MSFYTTCDPEYKAKSRYPSSQDYYAAEEAREEWEEMERVNKQLTSDFNKAEELNGYYQQKIQELQEENERLTTKCTKLEEWSTEQFNRAVNLQHDLDLLDKYEDSAFDEWSKF